MPTVMHEASLEHHPVLIPIFDIRCIGAGGGSIAWLEEGLLKVGPRSAGAVPGPIAYGKGGVEPTITDAALDARLPRPGGFLRRRDGPRRRRGQAGHRGSDRRAARHRRRLAPRPGMFDVVMARTVGAIREITVERGHDPREFSLLAFGGAGPLFAPLLAREMGIREIIVPHAPAAFSAWGMLMPTSPPTSHAPHIALLDELDLDGSRSRLRRARGEGRRRPCASRGSDRTRSSLGRAIELRYLGQEHALEVAVERGMSLAGMRGAVRRPAQGPLRPRDRRRAADRDLPRAGVGLVQKPECEALDAGRRRRRPRPRRHAATRSVSRRGRSRRSTSTIAIGFVPAIAPTGPPSSTKARPRRCSIRTRRSPSTPSVIS